MSKHTPGPWFASDEGVGGSHDRHSAWYYVAPWGNDPLGRAPPDVCLVQRKEDKDLIAAAPDLLAAIQEVSTCDDCGKDYGRCIKCQLTLDAAIAKAGK